MSKDASKILIVEDEAKLALVLRQYLEAAVFGDVRLDLGRFGSPAHGLLDLDQHAGIDKA